MLIHNLFGHKLLVSDFYQIVVGIFYLHFCTTAAQKGNIILLHVMLERDGCPLPYSQLSCHMINNMVHAAPLSIKHGHAHCNTVSIFPCPASATLAEQAQWVLTLTLNSPASDNNTINLKILFPPPLGCDQSRQMFESAGRLGECTPEHVEEKSMLLVFPLQVLSRTYMQMGYSGSSPQSLYQ